MHEVMLQYVELQPADGAGGAGAEAGAEEAGAAGARAGGTRAARTGSTRCKNCRRSRRSSRAFQHENERNHPQGAAHVHAGRGGRGVLTCLVRELAVGESSVIPLHPPLPVVGVLIRMERGCQQNDRTLMAMGHGTSFGSTQSMTQAFAHTGHCYSAGTPSPSILKRLRKGRGGCGRTARTVGCAGPCCTGPGRSDSSRCQQ